MLFLILVHMLETIYIYMTNMVWNPSSSNHQLTHTIYGI